MRRLCFWLLLGDTVDVTAAVSNFFGTDTDNLTFREHGLHLDGLQERHFRHRTVAG